MKPAYRMLLFLSLLITPAGITSAQVSTGTPPFGTFGGSSVDTINLANLNAHLTIPVIHKAGRGQPFNYDINYDSSVWTPAGSSGSQTWQPAGNSIGWSFQALGSLTTTGYQLGWYCYSDLPYFGWSITGVTTTQQFIYVDVFGTMHGFPGGITEYSGSCGSGYVYSGGGPAWDGSGYTLNVDSSGNATVTARNGQVVYWPNSTGGLTYATDTNGNQITMNTSGQFFDTLSSTTPVLTVSATAPTTQFTYTPPSGTNVHYTMTSTTFTVQTNFGCSGITEFPPTSQNLPTEIDLPDQGVNASDKYTFTYEITPGDTHSPHYVTGRIASLTLPTGGTINYTYTGANNGIVCTDGSTAGLTRQTPDGTWSYARTIGSGVATTSTITDPQNNQTVTNFQGIFATESQIYNGSSTSGTLLKTTLICYNGSTPSGTPPTCNSASVILPITQVTSYLQWPGANGQQSRTDNYYNAYGLLAETDEYAYQVGAPVSVVRKTLTSYASLGNGIVDRPASVTIEDGANPPNIKSQTTYCYDEGTPSGTTTCNTAGSPTATSGTPQHVSVTGSRGNVTTIATLVSGTNTLGKKSTYYDTGNVKVATDINGALTSYTYGACGNSFPTSISEALSLSKSITWNCAGGVMTSVTDENSKTVSTSYTDPYFWRPYSVTDQLSNVRNLSYTGQTSAEAAVSFNGGSSTVDIVATLDGLGRTRISQTRRAPGSSTLDSAETDYDSLGRPLKTTLPYSGTGGQLCSGSCPGTTTSYDALSRPISMTDGGNGTISFSYSQNDTYQAAGPAPTGENTKRKQLEYDALGRLTSVCEITSGSGSGNCTQTVVQTGYFAQYTYDVLNDLTGVSQGFGTQTRYYTYDGLGRMTSETNPESGTTNYTYDTDATCGTSKGDLVKAVDAVGNVTCYAYDALHRPTSVTYPSGSYATVTPRKYLVYDSATVNSVVMVNAKTRVAEAYTCFSPCSTKLTDIGLSYTARGEASDLYESTPHSGGYYHLNQTYWANGATNQISGLSGLPTITYNVDGEGRTYSATASSGQNPLSSTTYNVSSLPTAINLGSSDNDSFAYDPNTNRLTQYTFSVNGQSVIGNLTWNTVGTPLSLLVTDPFNSADTQSCSYTHDDLVRIASANCGSIWSQTFSYDAFGNIAKTGNPGNSFGPQYTTSPPTNRYSTISGSTPTYDANGNVTNDFLHNYAWDANGRPVTIDGVGVTYDAFGDIVEENRSGTYTQIVYAPTGDKLALMNGSTLQKGFVPLTGGAMAVYNSSGLAYYRHSDWLGSSRLASTPSRTIYSDGAYAPFGEAYAQTGTTDLSFTGMNQDTVSNLYDFPAREYGIQGRWPSPDPAGVLAVDPTDPQTWNRYAYVRNSPLMLVDLTGMDPCSPGALCVTTSACGWCYQGYQDFISWLTYLFVGQGPLLQATQSSPGAGGGAPLGGGGDGGGNGNTQPQPPPKDPNCRPDPGLSVKSVGATVGGTAGAGAGKYGGTAVTGSLGAVTGKGAPLVGTASGGAMTSAGSYVSGSPNQAPLARAYGAYIGVGASATISNGVPGQLRGPFRAMTVDVGLGPFNLGMQLACSGLVCQGSVTPPVTSFGFGALITGMATNTAVTTNQCKQGG